MPVGHIQHSVLLVSGAKAAGALVELMDTALYAPVTLAHTAGEARRALVDDAFDIILVNAPLPDESGQELAVRATETGYAGVLLLERAERFEEVCCRVESYGVLVVAKPLSRPVLAAALRLAGATRERFRLLENQKRKLQAKLEEIRIVDRAKWALIQYLQMDEAQAHRYIEKQAMDLRATRREIAEGILRMYES